MSRWSDIKSFIYLRVPFIARIRLLSAFNVTLLFLALLGRRVFPPFWENFLYVILAVVLIPQLSGLATIYMRRRESPRTLHSGDVSESTARPEPGGTSGVDDSPEPRLDPFDKEATVEVHGSQKLPTKAQQLPFEAVGRHLRDSLQDISHASSDSKTLLALEIARNEVLRKLARLPTIQRTPHLILSTHSALQPGTTFEVSVFADRAPWHDGEVGEQIAIPRPSWKSEFDIDVWLVTSADHFRVEESDTQIIIIRAQEERSTIATFRVTVVDNPAGPFGVVTALFAHAGRACGRVSRTVQVEGYSQSYSQRRLEALDHSYQTQDLPSVLRTESGRPADLTVRIASRAGDGQRFRCHLDTPLLPRAAYRQTENWNLPDTAYRWVLDKMSDFTRPGTSASLRSLALRAAGIALFEAAPRAFRELFWLLIDKGKALESISIVSEESYLPWELMVPTRRLPTGEVEKREPLGVEFLISRWTSREHVHPPQRLPLVDSYILAPKDSKLKKAAAEAKLVLELFEGESIDPAQIQEIENFLRRRARSLLHVVCHGKSVNGEQILFLENRQELKAYLLREMEGVAKALREIRPLVFINACDAGRKEPALVGTGGFAEAFMALDAGGIVAPLWGVKDDIAHEVAKEFYGRLKANPNTPFAEILRDIRRRAYIEGGGEDTWAAYCFYGDPLATAACPRSFSDLQE